jgi:hypothetical protein
MKKPPQVSLARPVLTGLFLSQKYCPQARSLRRFQRTGPVEKVTFEEEKNPLFVKLCLK